MRYAAYLDPDFIPLSLIGSLLACQDRAELDELANVLSRLSLMHVVTSDRQEAGLRVHRDVQESCQFYKEWTRAGSEFGTVDVLSRIA